MRYLIFVIFSRPSHRFAHLLTTLKSLWTDSDLEILISRPACGWRAQGAPARRRCIKLVDPALHSHKGIVLAAVRQWPAVTKKNSRSTEGWKSYYDFRFLS